MKSVFDRNITIKIISVLAALLFWIVVFNTENPYDERKVSVKLNFKKESSLIEKDIYLLNKDSIPRTVDVTIRGRSENVDQSIKDFSAVCFLDFSKVGSIEDNKIEIDGPYFENRDIYVSKVEPSKVELELEKIIKKTFPINIRFEGELREGYKKIKTVQDKTEFELEGLNSLIDRISYIEAVINIDSLDKSLNVEKNCVVYDIMNKRVSEFNNISVNVDIQVGKEVTIRPVIEGVPDSNYVKGIDTVSPQKIVIAGPSDLLSKINTIYTEPVNIDGASSTVGESVKFNLPEGVALVNGEPQTASVKVNVEKLVEAKYQMASNYVQLMNKKVDGSKYYELLDDFIEVVVKGRRSDIDRLESSDIQLKADVNGYSDGVHGVPVRVNVPRGFSFVSAESLNVKIESYKIVFIDTDKIELLNSSEDKEYGYDNSKIELILKGREKQLEGITADSIKPAVNVEDMEEGNHRVDIMVTLPSGISVVESTMVTYIDVKSINTNTDENPEETTEPTDGAN